MVKQRKLKGNVKSKWNNRIIPQGFNENKCIVPTGRNKYNFVNCKNAVKIHTKLSKNTSKMNKNSICDVRFKQFSVNGLAKKLHNSNRKMKCRIASAIHKKHAILAKKKQKKL